MTAMVLIVKNTPTKIPVIFICCIAVIGCASLVKESGKSMASDVQTKVILISTFHFFNPAKDVVKNKVHDVMQEKSQVYLQELAQRLVKFQPTVILLEYDVNYDQEINQRYAQYREGKYELTSDEVEQLGFRVAKLSGFSRVESFDERGIPWKAQDLFDQLKREPELERRFNYAIRQLTESEELDHSKLSLREVLRKYNQQEVDQLNKEFYILTNVAGVDQNFAGADAAASWWLRS